jgi:hypothetical protein
MLGMHAGFSRAEIGAEQYSSARFGSDHRA